MQLISAQHFADAHPPRFSKMQKEERGWREGRGAVAQAATDCWSGSGAGGWGGGNNPVSLGLCLDSPPPPATPRVIVRERSHGRIGVSHAFLAASSQTNTLLAVSPLVSVISLQWPPSSNCSLLPFSNAPPLVSRPCTGDTFRSATRRVEVNKGWI